MRKTRDLKTSIATVGVLLALSGAVAIAADLNKPSGNRPRQAASIRAT